MWRRFKQLWVWKHRTKSVGALGVIAGACENFLNSHDHLPTWMLHERGVALMIFGGAVTLVGLYNSMAAVMGWEDDNGSP
jgi:hypothetical protein